MQIDPLVSDANPALPLWLAGDQATYLDMACAEVRKFCGWHIAPSIPVTDMVCFIGQKGLVMLRSRHVTEISQVTIVGQTLTADTDYTWQAPKGWLRLHIESLNVPSEWPVPDPSVSVSFMHGYDNCPSDVQAVIFEVMATAMELPASNATEVMTMQYRFNLKDSVGISLSKDQKDRLNDYRLISFGGLVRP
jgi:hypothetical protein